MKSDIENIVEKFPGAGRDQLIPILQEMQEKFGYLSEEIIVAVGKHLSLPASKIYGVATFYNQFRFQPMGKYHIQVCRGTACHVLGSQTVLEKLQKQLGITAGQTTRDLMFSIEVVACIGACGLAPVLSINGEFYAKVTSDSITEIINNLRKEKENVA
ncbi:MAG: NADH-quinone oxidoreductase subunit NuoE [bacterium]